jgi:hypothetical protein
MPVDRNESSTVLNRATPTDGPAHRTISCHVHKRTVSLPVLLVFMLASSIFELVFGIYMCSIFVAGYEHVPQIIWPLP